MSDPSPPIQSCDATYANQLVDAEIEERARRVAEEEVRRDARRRDKLRRDMEQRRIRKLQGKRMSDYQLRKLQRSSSQMFRLLTGPR